MSVRETIIESGEMREVILTSVPCPPKKKTRAKKEKMTIPKQQVLNDTKSKRNLHRIIETNFVRGDYYIHLTLDDENLPSSPEEGQMLIVNYIRRLKYHWKKKFGKKKIKYVYVMEYGMDDEGKMIRLHFHMVLSDGLNRDHVEELWGKGTANADRLRPDKRGLEKVAYYLSKAKVRKGKRKYVTSEGLDKPVITPNKKSKFSKRKLEQIASYGEDDNFFYENLYPGYRFLECKITRNEHSGGTYIYLRMRNLRN